MKHVLVTGGAGFIGHHFVEHVLRNTPMRVTVLDRLDTSGNLNRLTDISCWAQEKTRVSFVHHDLKAQANLHVLNMIGDVDLFVHMAAGSHVDRSIEDPALFAADNVMGTVHALQMARCVLPESGLFVNFSTDEVFGPAPGTVRYREWDRFNPGNPYAASKAGAEAMADAFANTYRLPVITTHTMNVLGERQHPEKFLPMVIKRVLAGMPVTIHADKTRTRAGTRFYIHARNVADAVLHIYNNKLPQLDGSGQRGKYNIVGAEELSNLDLAQAVANILGKTLYYEMVDFHSSRPGHDLRYGLDGSLLASYGWKPPVSFYSSLKRTVNWYRDNQQWL